jgi:hypothetical protein
VAGIPLQSTTPPSWRRRFGQGGPADADSSAVLKDSIGKADAVVKGMTGAPVVGGVAAAMRGDSFTAASAVSEIAKSSPALAPVVVAADVAMILSGHKKLKSTTADAQKAVKTLESPVASRKAKVQSAIGLAMDARMTLLAGTQFADAASRLGHTMDAHGVARPMVQTLRSASRGIMSTPLGSLIRGLVKILPVLNVIGFANSAWIGVDICRDHAASHTTKLLAVGSILFSGLLVAASIFSPLAFLTLPAALGGLADELALYYARRNDKRRHDTDQAVASSVAHGAQNRLDSIKATLAGNQASA